MVVCFLYNLFDEYILIKVRKKWMVFHFIVNLVVDLTFSGYG